MEDKIMIEEYRGRINPGLYCLIHDHLRGKGVTLRAVWRSAGVREEDIPADFSDHLTLDVVWSAIAFGFRDWRERYLGDRTEIREAVFGRICIDTGLPYGFIYYLWQDDLEKAFRALYDGQRDVFYEDYDKSEL